MCCLERGRGSEREKEFYVYKINNKNNNKFYFDKNLL